MPVRGGPLFAATVKLTAPLLVLFVPEVIVIQGTLEAAVQVHPAPVLTVKLPVPPPAAIGWLLVDESEYEQPFDWVIVKSFPSTVIFPILSGLTFACTIKETAPFPVPGEPLLIVIHELVVPAVQVQPGVLVVTLKLPAPPAASKVVLDDESVIVQPLACETVKV